MKIIHKHNVPQDYAKQKIENNFTDLISNLPNGIKIKKIERWWNDYELDFSFKVYKGFFSLPISGKIIVEKEAVVFDIELPALISEDMIREVIAENLKDLF
ncbi:MAG: polyhydroxyalkanoic acid system family protein [Candidatus Cloacimonadota bacterium]|nr:polyhydroxyalkanoic acid system family protein [Candidatus Cloacimonadota bacterium]